MLCSALVLSLFGRDVVTLCDIPFTSLPPASFSFYKKVSENLLQAKVGERSMLGHTCLCVSVKDPPVPCVHTAICCRICMFCFISGQSSKFCNSLFFSCCWHTQAACFYLKRLGKTCWNEYLQGFFSMDVQAYPRGSAVDRQVGTAVPSCSLQFFMLQSSFLSPH